MDTAVTKKDGFKNLTNLTKIVKPFSSRKSTDRALVYQFSKKDIQTVMQKTFKARKTSKNVKTVGHYRPFICKFIKK